MKRFEDSLKYNHVLKEIETILSKSNHAGVAQLVEHNVANVVVVGSSLITRSLRTANYIGLPFFFYGKIEVCKLFPLVFNSRIYYSIIVNG